MKLQPILIKTPLSHQYFKYAVQVSLLLALQTESEIDYESIFYVLIWN